MRELKIIWLALLIACLLSTACNAPVECDTDTDCMLKNPTIEPY